MRNTKRAKITFKFVISSSFVIFGDEHAEDAFEDTLSFSERTEHLDKNLVGDG